MPTPAPQARERRRAHRFPLRLPVDFCVREGTVERTGRGETYDISSKAVLFTADFLPPVGWIVEVSIRWPIQIGEAAPILLIISGPVLRREHRGLVVLIKNYHFQHAPADV